MILFSRMTDKSNVQGGQKVRVSVPDEQERVVPQARVMNGHYGCAMFNVWRARARTVRSVG